MLGWLVEQGGSFQEAFFADFLESNESSIARVSH